MRRAAIYAEAGVNHNGRLDRAIRLAEAAKAVGADAVKFQTGAPDAEVAASAPLAPYQRRLGYVSQLAMVRELSLSFAETKTLARECERVGIEFFSTPVCPDSLRFLVEECGVKRIKIGSADMTNALLLDRAASTGLPLLISTGMATVEEISEAYFYVRHHPDVTLMQCESAYPADEGSANIAAMVGLAVTFGRPAGYSDHTMGTTAAVMAAAVGAAAFEKHLTLDSRDRGPDHAASLEPQDFAEYIAAIRAAEGIRGDGEKKPTRAEAANMTAARKSVVAARVISAGEIFTPDNLAVKRPAGGISPLGYFDLTGKPANRDYAPDERIDASVLS